MLIETQQKAQKRFHEKKPKFENYKNCLESTHLENKINHLENKEDDADSVKKIINN